jgi:hypothetical protein
MLYQRELSTLFNEMDQPPPRATTSGYHDYQCEAQAGVEERRRQREETEAGVEVLKEQRQ